MSTGISSIGILFSSTSSLVNEQTTLAQLNQQLATSQKYSNLTDYDPTSASRLISFQNAITQKTAYLSTMQTVQSRLSLYDTSLSDLETVAQQGANIASSNQTYDPTKLSSLQAQANTYLKQITDDLNLKAGDRYLFSGVRYSTTPVTDLSQLSGVPTTVPVSGPTLPDYDNALVTSGTTADANAYTKDSVAVDAGYSVTYGITSTDPSIQKLVAGLRYIKQATTETDSAAYQSDMEQASTLLTAALSGIQSVHTQLASNQNTLTSETTLMNTNITSLQNQITDTQHVDLTTVGTEINLLQTQLSASYSATANLLQLSILKYL